MSDHTCCLGIHMCRDKISCPRQQLNGGFRDCAGHEPDRPTLSAQPWPSTMCGIQ